MEGNFIFEKLKALYKSNNLHDCHNKIVQEGIIDPNLFGNQKIRVLFIAKEHNHLDNPLAKGDADDYQIWWQERVHLQFAHHISEWACGILNGSELDYVQLTPDQKYLALRSIAFINVKKACGNSKANPDIIFEYIDKSRDLIHEQITMISPQLIICCFRKDYLIEQLFQCRMNRDDSGNYSYGRR